MRLQPNVNLFENLQTLYKRYGNPESWYGALNGSKPFQGAPPIKLDPYTPLTYDKEIPQHMRYWHELVLHLSNWYWEPDIEALQMVLSAIAIHYATKELPFWLFLVGDSGAGKTVIFIEPLLTLPRTHLISTVTPAAFFPGTGQGNVGLIGKDKTSEVFLFKDFTTILAMDPNKQKTVLSILREIADGSFDPRFGSQETPTWRGRVTAIAATTPAVEAFLAEQRLYGDRFFSIHLNRPADDREIMRWAARQERYSPLIRKKTNALMANLMSIPRLQTANALLEDNSDSPWSNTIESLGILVPKLRIYCTRNWKRQIIDVPNGEVPTRFGKAFLQAARGHAMLFSKPKLDSQDFAMSKRLALGTIPKNRKTFLTHLGLDEQLTMPEFLHRSRMPLATFKEEVEDLRSIQLLYTDKDAEAQGAGESLEHWISWHPKFRQLLKDSELVVK